MSHHESTLRPEQVQCTTCFIKQPKPKDGKCGTLTCKGVHFVKVEYSTPPLTAVSPRRVATA